MKVTDESSEAVEVDIDTGKGADKGTSKSGGKAVAGDLQVTCDRAALADAVAVAASVVPSRSPSPVLQCVRLRAADGQLVFAVTDGDLRLVFGLEQVDVRADGELLVPADRLAQVVRACDDATLTLTARGEALLVEGDHARFEIYGHDPSDAPAIDLLSADGIDADFTIEAGTLQELVERTIFAISSEQNRYAINGVNFSRDGRKLQLVATDGRRLALAEGRCLEGEGQGEAILPTKTLQTLQKIVAAPDEKIEVAFDETSATFRVGDRPGAPVLASRLVEGKFPPYREVIPKQHDRRIEVNTNELAAAIRRAAILTDARSKGVTVEFTPDAIVLSGRASEVGESRIEVAPLTFEGEPVTLTFHPSYITEALRVVEQSSVEFLLGGPGKPGVLKEGKNFTYVVMPIQS